MAKEKDNEKALENIKKKCLGLIKNLTIKGISFEFESYNEHINSLSIDVLKIRNEWIDYYDIFKIFFNVLGELPLEIPNSNMNQSTRLWDIIGEEKGNEISNKLFDFYISTPRTYNIYIPLPNVHFEITQRISITPEISFHTYQDIILSHRPGQIEHSIGPQLDSFITKDNIYLKLKLSGFFGNNLDSSLPKKVVELFKIIIYFGLHHGVFKHDPELNKTKVILQDTHHLQMKRFYLFSEDCNSNYTINDRIELPLEISLLLNSITLNKKLFQELANEFKEVIFIDQVTNLMLSKSFHEASALYKSTDEDALPIRSAILWYMDALSNENKTLSFLQLCIGLEAIFGDFTYETGLTKTLADRCAYVVSKSLKERKTIRVRFQTLYKIRSKIVHGKTLTLDRNDEGYLLWGRQILKKAIWKELEKLELDLQVGNKPGTKIAETSHKSSD